MYRRPISSVTRQPSNQLIKLCSILQPSIVNLGTPSQITIPKIIYSTSYKRGKTENLVYQAIKVGYRGIETGSEPLKYEEKLVGDGIRRAIKKEIVKREELYIQTTFAPPLGQNFHKIPSGEKGNSLLEDLAKKLPYKLTAPIPEQIHSSIASSLKNLKTSEDEKDTYIDCVIFCSQYPTRAETKEAWDVLSTYVPHPVRSLGITTRQLANIGEDNFLQEEEKDGGRPWRESMGEYHAQDSVSNEKEPKADEKKVVPSVYMNSYLTDISGKNIGLNLQKYPKKDMVFQSSWSPGMMYQLAHHPVTYVICDILKELGFDQGNKRTLAIYVLLLSLRVHGFTILAGNLNANNMKGDIEALKALENWIRDPESKERWERVEMKVERFCHEAGWYQDGQKKESLNRNVNEEGSLKSENAYEGRREQNRDIDESADSSLESENPISTPPTQEFPTPSTSTSTSTPTLRWKINRGTTSRQSPIHQPRPQQYNP